MPSYTQNLEFHLVRAIVRGQGEAVAAFCAAVEFDSEAFLRYVDTQRVAACIFHAAQSHALIPLLPEKTVEFLRRSFLTQWRWNFLLLGRIAELDRKLHECGREVIFLKGLHLTERYFGQLAARQIGDIDILINRHQDLLAYEEILDRLGYRRRSRILGSRKLMTRYTHHLEFDGPLAPLDLHWVLRQHPSFALDYSEVWRRKTQVKIRNVEFLALDPEHDLVFQILSIHSDIEVGILRLKSFVDLYAILRRIAETTPWERFLAHRAEEGLLNISVNVLDIFLDILDCREEFVSLAEALARHRGLILLTNIHSKVEIFQRAGAAQSRAWALRLYDTSLFHAFFWWMRGIPFRVAQSSRLVRRRTRPPSAEETCALNRSTQSGRPWVSAKSS